ncbi:MAG: amino acid ABC transporter substrate-binding protein [Acidimicrobiia bacterium]|nr:amino acid ABC transporter substrate-binding protein [Acidimicrobiia bacterium]MYC57075.1 amino acid ABC transporter substrate-binding protein [Acidimicrobiia bacterium]MYG93682.1 amino acid ABC transporter substrate-binding protein [Acidimicrobiia bacterium]MYI30152.1 amino acid ABC transporter substrate-binding protein [Acidimicrobiia bacterium]
MNRGDMGLTRHKLTALVAVAVLLFAGCGLFGSGTVISPELEATAPQQVGVNSTPVSPVIPDGAPLPDNAILIGALMATRGFLSTYDEPALVAAQNRVDALNTDGGLLGRPLVLRHIESHTELSVMKNGAEQLLLDGIDLLLVTCDAVYAQPALEELQDSGTLVISPCGTDDAWTTGELGERVFSLGTPVSTEASMLADLMIERGLDTSVVVIDQTSTEAMAVCEAFQQSFDKQGGRVLSLFRYQPTDPGLIAPILAGLALANPEAIVFCGTRLVAPEVLAPIRQAGHDQPIFANSSMDGDYWLGRVPQIGDFTMLSYGSVYADSADPNPQVRQVLDSYFATTGHRANDGRLITGHDAIEAYVRAVTRAGTTNPAAVAAELRQFHKEGFAAGSVSFGLGRHAPVDRPMRVIVVEEPFARFDRIISLNDVEGRQ